MTAVERYEEAAGRIKDLIIARIRAMGELPKAASRRAKKRVPVLAFDPVEAHEFGTKQSGTARPFLPAKGRRS